MHTAAFFNFLRTDEIMHAAGNVHMKWGATHVECKWAFTLSMNLAGTDHTRNPSPLHHRNCTLKNHQLPPNGSWFQFTLYPQSPSSECGLWHHLTSHPPQQIILHWHHSHTPWLVLFIFLRLSSWGSLRKSSRSQPCPVTLGVSQDSVLRPHLLITWLLHLGNILCKFNVHFYCFADETHLSNQHPPSLFSHHLYIWNKILLYIKSSQP